MTPEEHDKYTDEFLKYLKENGEYTDETLNLVAHLEKFRQWKKSKESTNINRTEEILTGLKCTELNSKEDLKALDEINNSAEQTRIEFNRKLLESERESKNVIITDNVNT